MLILTAGKNCPSMMDSDPWEPPAAEAEPDKPKE